MKSGRFLSFPVKTSLTFFSTLVMVPPLQSSSAHPPSPSPTPSLRYSIMLILGFFSLRNEEVKSRANLSGSVDVDEVQSSATARCCLALEKRVEETKKNVSVPEDEITISVVYKVALVVAIYCLSFTPVIGFILLGLQFLDPRLWKVGVGMIQLGTITNPIACISTADRKSVV